MFVLSSHYRSPATWSEDALAAAARGAERLRTALENAEDLLAGGEGRPPHEQAGAPDLAGAAGAARAAFEAAMDDDFNTPGALAALFELASAVNRVTDAVQRGRDALTADRRDALGRGCAVLRELGGVLGLRLAASATPAQVAGLHRLAQELSRERPDLFDPGRLPAVPAPPPEGAGGADPAHAEALIRYIGEGRVRARRERDWATGDRIRARLHDLGVLLEDTPTGFKWRVR